MGNNFIGTAEGFLKDIVWNDDHKCHEIQFTEKLREAKRYGTRKQALNILDNNSFDGFVFNPWTEETAPEHMYEVVKQTYNSFWDDGENEKDPDALIYIAKKVLREKKSDALFISTRGVDKRVLYSKEDAEDLAQQLNREMLTKLTAKLSK